MKITKQAKEALAGLEWALAEFIPKPIQPGEFTTVQFVERSGLNRNTATSILAKKEQAGELKSRLANVDGKSVRLYRKA